MINRVTYTILFCLGIIGCDPVEYKRSQDIENAGNIQNLTYIKDKKSGLCFAASGLGYPYAVLTNIPCTPEVEKLVFSL